MIERKYGSHFSESTDFNFLNVLVGVDRVVCDLARIVLMVFTTPLSRQREMVINIKLQ